MNIKKSLESELKKALVEKNDIRKQTIRLVISSIKNVEIDKKKELTDEEILSILQKEIKMREEALKEAENAARADLIEKNKNEIEILKEFLPEQLSEAEILQLAKEVIDEVQPSGVSDMGKVMKALIPRLEGRASGSQASKIVSDLLKN